MYCDGIVLASSLILAILHVLVDGLQVATRHYERG